MTTTTTYARTIGHLFTRASFVIGDRATLLRIPAPHGEVFAATIGGTSVYVTVNAQRVTVWHDGGTVDAWDVTTPRADAARAFATLRGALRAA